MGLRAWLMRLLDRGAEAGDGNEMVELETVPLAAGPVLLEALRQRGVIATGAATFSVVTNTLSDFRISVRRRDWAAASAVVAELDASEGA